MGLVLFLAIFKNGLAHFSQMTSTFQILEMGEHFYPILNRENTGFMLCHLTWIVCKDSREGSSQSHVGSNFIILFFLKCKLEHIKPNFMTLAPGVFEIQ